MIHVYKGRDSSHLNDHWDLAHDHSDDLAFRVDYYTGVRPFCCFGYLAG